MKIIALTLTALIASASVTHAQQYGDEHSNKVSGYVGVGVFATPEFEGSEDMQAVPLLAARVAYDNYYVETQGLGVRANVSPFKQVEFGPSLNYRFGRDDDANNDVIARLSEIDDAVEAGGFIKVPFNNVLKARDELAFNIDARTDISDAHDGTLVSFGPSYSYAMNQRIRLTTSLSATYADDDFMESYYSINAADSIASGLNQFDAEGGIKDVGVTLVGNYAFNEKWGLIMLVGYQKLLGDAQDSSIVQQEGDDNQFMGGLGVSYRF